MYDSYHLISTPENVDLRLELAGVGNRVLACFIDTVLTYVLIALLWTIIGLFAWAWSRSVEYFHFDIESKIGLGISIGLVALAMLGTFVITFGYFIFFEGLWQGQTLGKKIAGIRVVRENGEPVSWQTVLLRNVLRTIDEGIFLIGIIFMVVEKDEKRLGDLAAGTFVIRERKAIQLPLPKPLPDTAVNESSSKDNFANVSPAAELDQADYELLSSFLRRRKYMLRQQRTDLAKQLADYLSIKINREQQENTSANPEVFLERLL